MRERNNSKLLNKYISQQDICEDIELIESTNGEEKFITRQNNLLGWII